jgi:hypothetical protein
VVPSLDIPYALWYVEVPMTNKEIAEALIRGKRTSYLVKNFKLATAIRVAGHRLGGVLTAKGEKKGWRLVKSSARVWHKKKAVKRRLKRR